MFRAIMKFKKPTYIILLLTFIFSACDFTTSFFANKKDTEIVVKRFDRLEYQYITTGEFSALQQMCTDYPTETRTLFEDILKVGQMSQSSTNQQILVLFQDSIMQRISRDAEEKYANMDKLNESLSNAFDELREMFPDIPIPTVYAQITALDQSIIIKDGSIGISLDKYMGEDYLPYKTFFDKNQCNRMTCKMIVPDCILFYLLSIYPLEDFQNATQDERDRHIGKMLWVANKVSGFKAFNDEPLKRAEAYIKAHPDITPVELFERY